MIVLTFFLLKTTKGELKENFYGQLIEQSENCSLGDEETTLNRDTFILNMLDYDTRKKFSKTLCH